MRMWLKRLILALGLIAGLKAAFGETRQNVLESSAASGSVVTNVGTLGGEIGAFNFAVSNGIAWFKRPTPGRWSYILDTGTGLVFGVTNIALDAGDFTGILPPANLGSGTKNGNTFLCGTGAFVSVSASANITAVSPINNALVNGTNVLTFATNGNAGTYLNGTGVFSAPTNANSVFSDANNTYATGTVQSNWDITQRGVAVLDATNVVTSISGKSFSTIAYSVGAQNVGSPTSASNTTLALSTSFRLVTVTNTPVNFNAISGSAGSGLARTDLIVGTNNANITFSGSSFRFQFGYQPPILNLVNDTNIILWANMGSSGPLIQLATYYSRDPRSRTYSSSPINQYQTNSARVSLYTAIFTANGATSGRPILEVRNSSGAILGRIAHPSIAATNDYTLSGITIQPNEAFVLTNLSTGSGTSLTLVTNILTEATVN